MNWQAFWQKKSLGNIILLPLSALFYVLMTLRRLLYQSGVLKSEHAERPVIVIGNINVGGAGKTPLVIALANLLIEQGIACAVVSKGYGGSFTTPTIVENNSLASVVGDEPLLVKLRCDCPVVVAKSRIAACHVVSTQFPDTQIILTDDGLQHYQLARDVNVCVINSKIGLGNGWVLPAGGLREPPSRLKTMDFVVHNGTTEQAYHYILAERGWWHIGCDEKRYPDEFSEDNNVILSGIAHPALFFDRVSDMGIEAQETPLPDHYALQQKDLPEGKTILMTEKDWVKAKELTHDDAWYLATEAILSAALQRDFLIKIQQLIEE